MRIKTGETYHMRSVASVAAGRILGTMFVISVIALIVSVVLYVLNNQGEPIYTNEYVEIPAMICDYRTVEDNSKYIYYYGVTNPYLSTTEALYPDNENNSKTLPRNLRNVMDIYNWELKGDRQWVCLYQTRDINAGRPIIADSLKINGTEIVENTVGMTQFNVDMGSIGFNIAGPYNQSIKSLEGKKGEPSNITNYQQKNLYIHYTVDLNAKYTQTPQQKIISAFLGSMFTTGSGWAMAGIGTALGVVIGVIVDRTAKKKQKATADK